MLKETEKKMEKSIAFFAEDLDTVRAGRANPAILNKIMIDYFGVATPINQTGNISVPEAHMIVIQPWDATVLPLIEKAIATSDLGVNPQNDGKVIRLNFPAPTEERRKELCKTVSKKAEDAKVAIRAIRRDALDDAKKQKKNNEITEDDLKGIENDIQKLTDAKIKEIDAISAKKQKEISEV